MSSGVQSPTIRHVCVPVGFFDTQGSLVPLYFLQHSAGGIHVLRPNGIHNKYAVCTGYSPPYIDIYIYIYNIHSEESCMPHTSTIRRVYELMSDGLMYRRWPDSRGKETVA